MTMTPMQHVDELDRIDREATDWFLELQEKPVPAAVRDRFNVWLEADTRHAAAYRETEACWDDFNEMTHWADKVEVPEIAPAVLVPEAAPVPLWQKLFGLGGMPGYARLGFATAVLVFVGYIGLTQFSPGLWVQAPVSYETGVAEIREITLADGSALTLGASSSAEVQSLADKRQVVLHQGEAVFSVTKNQALSLFVQAGETSVQVLGTVFEVHHGPGTVRVGVQEGRVKVVKAAGEDAASYMLSAGEQVTTMPAGQKDELTEIDISHVGAWRTGRLVYEDARLADVVADANRYYAGRIELADAGLNDLPVTASFQTSEIEKMISVLTIALPVKADFGEGGHIVIKRKS